MASSARVIPRSRPAVTVVLLALLIGAAPLAGARSAAVSDPRSASTAGGRIEFRTFSLEEIVQLH
jgi:hypothetical protein